MTNTRNHTFFHLLFMSRVLPLWPQGHQAAHYGAHVSPSLRAPTRPQTHLYLTPFGSFPYCFCFSLRSVCCSCFLVCLLHFALPELASRLPAHSLQFITENTLQTKDFTIYIPKKTICSVCVHLSVTHTVHVSTYTQQVGHMGDRRCAVRFCFICFLEPGLLFTCAI